MAVTMAMMPTTGLTLPFMSYGRTSLVISLVATGILLSIGRQRGKPAKAGGQAVGRSGGRR
jgi:cell division protein FtsW